MLKLTTFADCYFTDIFNKVQQECSLTIMLLPHQSHACLGRYIDSFPRDYRTCEPAHLLPSRHARKKL